MRYQKRGGGEGGLRIAGSKGKEVGIGILKYIGDRTPTTKGIHQLHFILLTEDARLLALLHNSEFDVKITKRGELIFMETTRVEPKTPTWECVDVSRPDIKADASHPSLADAHAILNELFPDI